MINKLTPEQFAMVCFLAIMQDLDHTIIKYIDDQSDLLLRSGYDAFSYISKEAQLKVIGYHEIWELELPKQVQFDFHSV
jgi:hypothetical protein